jgi:hypothetical protein
MIEVFNLIFIGFFLNETIHCLVEKKWNLAAFYSTTVILNIIAAATGALK